MAYTAQTQSALYYARRRRIARQVLQSLTAWTSGLSVVTGQYVSSENQTSAWLAVTSGITGASAPTGQAVLFDDGGVSWTKTDVSLLSRFQFSGAPTPA